MESMNYGECLPKQLVMAMIFATCACGTSLHAQSVVASQSGSANENPQATEDRISRLEAEVAELKTMIKQLQPAVVASAAPVGSERQTESEPPVEQRSTLQREDRKVLDFLRDTTIDVALDGYYAYNFNHPVGRVNLLRAYDV